MNLIPLPYRILIVLAIGAALFAGGWWQGSRHVHAEWDAAMLKQSLKVADVEKRQAEGAVQVVTQYVDRIQVVREKGATITKEIPVYVPTDTCSLPGGFRLLHDAAARGELPDPAGIADAAPVAAQDLAATVSENYTVCHANAEQVRALQDFIRAMKKAAEW